MLWATDNDYMTLEMIWMFYQDKIQAYGHPKTSESKNLKMRIINAHRRGDQKGFEELAQLGRELWCRR